MTQTLAPSRPRPGDTIDGYVVLGRRLPGHGGREEYDARDPERECPVILRFVREADASPSALARVRREARSLSELAHPNIVNARGLGVHDGRLFVVMDAIDAIPLDRYIADRSPTWRTVVARFIEAGRGLAAAHARAIVHRRICSRAIVIDDRERGLLGDFALGLSPWPTDSPRDAPLDALRVMAPEHVQGRRATVFSDQFAYCAALWHAVSGDHPLGPIDDRDALLAALTGERRVQPPASRRALRRLWRIIEPGLAREPADRYGSMHELLRALEGAARSPWHRLWPRRDPGSS